jgi:hypothetical protein
MDDDNNASSCEPSSLLERLALMAAQLRRHDDAHRGVQTPG